MKIGLIFRSKLLLHGLLRIIEGPSNGSGTLEVAWAHHTAPSDLGDVHVVCAQYASDPGMIRGLTSRVPTVVFFSARPGTSLLHSLYQAGCRTFLSTDADPADITRAITNAGNGGALYNDGQIITRATMSAVIDPANDPNRLTTREIEVLILIANGMKDKDAAATLGIRFKTLVTHKANIMGKLGIHTKVGLAMHAVREGFLETAL
jgi:DNA-binding NarL/FixJ family response regulator